MTFISENERLRDIQFSSHEIKVLTTLFFFVDLKKERMKLNNKDAGFAQRHDIGVLVSSLSNSENKPHIYNFRQESTSFDVVCTVHHPTICI